MCVRSPRGFEGLCETNLKRGFHSDIHTHMAHLSLFAKDIGGALKSPYTEGAS